MLVSRPSSVDPAGLARKAPRRQQGRAATARLLADLADLFGRSAWSELSQN